MIKITLKTFLRIMMRTTCKTVSIEPCINIEEKIKISQFIYTDIFVTRTMKFLAVVTTPYIYHGFSTQKTLWEYK